MRNLWLIGLAFLTGCQTHKPVIREGTATPATREEEVEVLVALLKAQFRSFTNASPVLVLQEEFSLDLIAWPSSYRKFSQDLIAEAKASEQNSDSLRDYTYVPTDAVREFCDKNQRREPIWPELEAQLPTRLLSKQEARDFFKHQQGEKPDGWDRFYAAYPGSPGIITISRVGFNQRHDIAVVYLGCQRHWLSGNGGINVFRKKNGKWEPQLVLFGPMWVS
jgi:hypothetical protein